MNNRYVILMLMLTTLSIGKVVAQDNTKKIFGLSVGAGMFFADKYVAGYYNGHSSNENNLDYLFNNEYWLNDIKNELHGYDVKGYYYAQDMKYKMAAPLSVRFFMNVPSGTVFLDVNQINLIAAGLFTIEIDSNTFTSEPALRMGELWGRESRTILDLGYRYVNETESFYNWFVEFAASFTNTVVRENYVKIGSFEQSIMYGGVYTPGQPLYEPQRQSGLGIGLMADFGFEVLVTKTLSIDLLGQLRMMDINLGEYKKFTPNYGIILRINLLAF